MNSVSTCTAERSFQTLHFAKSLIICLWRFFFSLHILVKEAHGVGVAILIAMCMGKGLQGSIVCLA